MRRIKPKALDCPDSRFDIVAPSNRLCTPLGVQSDIAKYQLAIKNGIIEKFFIKSASLTANRILSVNIRAKSYDFCATNLECLIRP